MKGKNHGALMALDRTTMANGTFKPTDNDDRRYAKWLVDKGLFEAWTQRQLNGRNATVYKLTEQGQKLFNTRREMRMEIFRQIAEKSAETL